jgi:hypothetical protein
VSIVSSASAGVDAQRETAWLRHQIVVDHEPREQVVAKFNGYATTPIEIVTPALRQLQTSGVFSIDDPEAFIAFLRAGTRNAGAALLVDRAQEAQEHKRSLQRGFYVGGKKR